MTRTQNDDDANCYLGLILTDTIITEKSKNDS